MQYKISIKNLYHGTDVCSAKCIREEGFKIQGNANSWCGKGVYFYDIKNKAWWAADRKCNEIKRQTNKKLKSDVIIADIKDIDECEVFDLRKNKDLNEFMEFTKDIFSNYTMQINECDDEFERQVQLRSYLISFFCDKERKKLVIGQFAQKEQKLFEEYYKFSKGLGIVFGTETIYCVKNINILENIH